MIFNSITRELNQQDSSRVKQSLLKNSRSSYFPQKNFPSSNIFENIPEATYPRQKNQSALAKMNNKISQSIEYLRYKDKIRANELRSSRVSSSSNRTYRSNHSNKSLKGYQASSTGYFPDKNEKNTDFRAYLPSEQSKTRTFVPPQSYLKDDKSSKNNYNYWKEQSLGSSYQKKFGSNEFKYFTRNPITIGSNYNPPQSRLPERDTNQQLMKSTHSNPSQSMYDMANSQGSHINTLQSDYNKPVSGIQWNASFGGSMRNSKITPSHEKIGNTPPFQSSQDKETSKPDTNQQLSPLSKAPSSKANKGIIISAGLIALGVLILLLQILK